MDSSAHLQGDRGEQQCYWSCPSSDSDFYNLSSPETVSPTACMDFSFSSSFSSSSSFYSHYSTARPLSTSAGGLHTKAAFSPSSSEEGGRLAGGRMRKSRAKNPSKQRESASEKEKLRMRDLTKALHHLRTYLPASVAPEGQTLTKIETLRLTIGYISHLAAQLGPGKEDARQMRNQNQNHPAEGQTSSWSRDSPLARHQFHAALACRGEEGEQRALHISTHPSARTEGQPISSKADVWMRNDPFNSSLDSMLESPEYAEMTNSCQVYSSKDVHYQNIAPGFWI